MRFFLGSLLFLILFSCAATHKASHDSFSMGSEQKTIVLQSTSSAKLVVPHLPTDELIQGYSMPFGTKGLVLDMRATSGDRDDQHFYVYYRSWRDSDERLTEIVQNETFQSFVIASEPTEATKPKSSFGSSDKTGYPLRRLISVTYIQGEMIETFRP